MNAPILCWWGGEVRIIDPSGACSVHAIASASDPLPEILRSAAAGCRGAGLVRIVYQPDTLEVREVGLAGHALKPGRAGESGRNQLRTFLAREIPALEEPGTVWCVSPGEDGAAGAVLYFERNSPLPAIVEGLARGGVRAEGAWPLPALADFAPPSGARRGSLTLAATADRAAIAWVSVAGDRSVESHATGDIQEAAISSLRTALARFDESERPPGWLAVEEGPAASAIRSAAAGLGLTEVSVPDFLSRVRLLSPGDWPDFLPARPWWRRPRSRRALAATAAALLILAFVLSLRIAAGRKSAQLRLRQDEEAARLHVRAEAGERETRLERMRLLATAEAELKPARSALGDFLPALAASVPKNAVLDELAVDGGKITISGRICDHSSRPGDVAARLCADLAPPGAAWALRPDPQPHGGSDFVLRGAYEPRPQSPEQPAAAPGDKPEALARSEAGFAEACARLPAAGSFENRLGDLMHGAWISAGLTAERRSSYELRHYSFRFANPRLGDWPEIVGSIRILCDEPALTIDRLILTAAPDGAAVFTRAELALTVRLRP
jgi:hypothetical protein